MALATHSQTEAIELQPPRGSTSNASVRRRSTIDLSNAAPLAPASSLPTPAPTSTDPNLSAAITPQILLLITSLTLAVFLVALDTTILTTAIPSITNDFHSLGDVGWYGSAYALTTSVFQLLFGRFYTIFSTKWTFLSAILVFEAGSALCGAAPSSVVFILGRALAGVGSAGIFAGAMIVIAQTIPLRWRSLYSGIFGALYGVASVIGPPMGGIFTEKLSWRWCFYINLPFGAVTVITLVWFFNPVETPREEEDWKKRWRVVVRKVDFPSSVSLVGAVICLLLALQWGGTTYSWRSPRVIALFIISVLSTAMFITIQVRRGNEAFLPLRILSQRTVIGCCWFAFSGGASFVVLLYYLPIYFQAILARTPLQSGLMNLHLVLSLVFASLASGVAVPFAGYYTPFLIASSLLRTLGALLLTRLTTHSKAVEWASYQVVYGLGDGCGMQHPLIAVQTVLPAADVPMGIAVLIFVQTLAGAVFVSIGQAVFQSSLTTELRERAPDVNAVALIANGATAFRRELSEKQLALVLPAYNSALMKTLVISVVMAGVSIVGSATVEWKKVKPTKKSAVEGNGVARRNEREQ